MLFVHPSDRLQAAEIVERELRLSGARSIDWRIVPTDRAAVLRAQRDTTPTVLQVVGGFDDGRAGDRRRALSRAAAHRADRPDRRRPADDRLAVDAHGRAQGARHP